MTPVTPTTALDAVDLRSGGRWSRAQWVKNTLWLWVVRVAVRFADALPAGWLAALGARLGRACTTLLPAERTRARSALGAAGLDDPTGKRVEACFTNAGRNLALSLWLRRPRFRALDQVDVDDESVRVLGRALEPGRGVVFVSAHLGPFEWVAAVIAELGFRPAIVVRESYDPRLDVLVDHHRRLRGIDVIHRGAASAPLRIVRALRAGRPVGFLPDLGGRVPALSTAFLGQRVLFPLGPQRLAQRMGAPIVIGTLVARPEQRWALNVRSLDSTGGEPELTQRVASALAARVLESPEHWPWMAPRFRALRG